MKPMTQYNRIKQILYIMTFVGTTQFVVSSMSLFKMTTTSTTTDTDDNDQYDQHHWNTSYIIW